MAINKKQAGVIVAGVAAIAIIGGGVVWAVSAGNSAAAENAAPAAPRSRCRRRPSSTSRRRMPKTGPRSSRCRPRSTRSRRAASRPSRPASSPSRSRRSRRRSACSPADDDATSIGTEADLGSLIADGLGLEYNPVAANWADWPLGIQSGKYDLIASNVTVTEERKELYDFASYRQDLLGFYVQADSDIDAIEEADDISGLKIIVGSGTNQEKILLAWNEELEAGRRGARRARLLRRPGGSRPSRSRRAASTPPSARTPPRPIAPRRPVRRSSSASLNGGWPETAPIAAGTAKGNGLIEPVQLVLQLDHRRRHLPGGPRPRALTTEAVD